MQLKQFDAARALILARWDEKDLALSCDPKRSGLGEMMSQWMGTNQGWLDEKGMLQVCAPSVRAWLESGKPPTVELPAIKALRVFDPRSQCAQVSFEMPNPLEAALLKGHMSAVELAKLRVRQAWPKLMEGCESYESQSSESLSAAYGQNILRNEYQSALASVSVQRPTSLLLFGDTLPLPSTECDFDQAPDCSKTKPLTTLSAQRIAQRLSKLNSNLTADVGQCTNTPEAERERLEALEKTLTSAVEKIMSKPAQTAAQRLAAIDKLLDNSLSGLGYELHQMLAKPLLQLAATEPKGAIAAQKKLIAALGMKAGETHWTQLARLQLTGRQADDAANSLKMALSLDYDSKTAAMLALLEAVQAGARPPFFQTPKRPWTHEVELFLLDEGQSDLDLVYLGALPNTVIEEFRVRQDWNRVLRAGAFAALDFDADEESENSGPAAKLALSGKWQGQSFQVGGWQLPWPDTFSVPEMEAKSLGEQERAKLFAALGITVN